MYAGRVVESGPSLELLSEPRHPYSFALLRSVPDPDAPVHRLLTIPGQPPDLTEEASGCAFAPRCPFAADGCTTTAPPLVAVEQRRATACVRHEEWDRWGDLVGAEPAAGPHAGTEGER
jgi:oligopeptide/dipeptide ABC transporter ATP-binding protein